MGVKRTAMDYGCPPVMERCSGSILEGSARKGNSVDRDAAINARQVQRYGFNDSIFKHNIDEAKLYDRQSCFS